MVIPVGEQWSMQNMVILDKKPDGSVVTVIPDTTAIFYSAAILSLICLCFSLGNSQRCSARNWQ
jgi:hypothetical protein